MKTDKSSNLFREAKKLIPGGVNSPVRAFRNVDGEPFFVNQAKGCYIEDVDGNRMIDYVGTWGPAILGHAPECVCLLYTSPSPRDLSTSRMPSSA